MLNHLAAWARMDFRPGHAQPQASRLMLAAITAIAGSLGADAVLVAVGQAVYPGTRGYEHFQFADYAKQTVVGVSIACAAWPLVTRISAAPRWLHGQVTRFPAAPAGGAAG